LAEGSETSGRRQQKDDNEWSRYQYRLAVAAVLLGEVIERERREEEKRRTVQARGGATRTDGRTTE